MGCKGMRKSTNKGLSLDEIKYLRESIKKYSKGNGHRKKYLKRDVTLFELLINTGLRRSEVANLKMSDLFLDTVHPNVLIRKSKNDTSRQVFISDHLKGILQDYLEWRKNHFPKVDFLFISERGTPLSRQTIGYRITQFLKNAGLYTPLKSTHCLRHFFGTYLYESSHNLRLTQEQMGHKDISTTQVYIYLSQKEIDRGVKAFDEVLNGTSK